ncbi:MAG: ABC transporter permease [Planctomycetaceae bacterium]
MDSSPKPDSKVPRTAKAGWFSLRRPIPLWQSGLLAALSIACVFGVWWFVTRQEVREDRIVGYNTLPSLGETFTEFKTLWFDRELTRNAFTTIRRVALGFGLACVVGIPLGVLAGCFTRVAAMLSPLIIFGRNIPIAALIPLTFFFFGIAESQKVMFIFLASVSFIIADSSQAIRDVGQRYIDTAKTLGASTWQIMMKVLVPLAMPAVFNSLRVLFGIAFGYIMLAEVVKLADEQGGLGYLIRMSQRRGPREHIYLIILIIPLLAFTIDRFLFWVQKELFPHRYGGYGILNRGLGKIIGLWDNLKCGFLNSEDPGPPKPSEWKP